MQSEEVQSNSSHLAEEISAVRPDYGNICTRSISPPQESRVYIPNVFRGINTTGSYHVYGDIHIAAEKLEASQNIRCSLVPGTNMAHNESSTIVSHSLPSHVSYLPTIIHPAVAHGSFQGPTAPMEEDSIQHPQTTCVRRSPGFSKGVICSPQSPLRSDCQPNSPTESSSSRNASMSLTQPSDSPNDAKARNWKKYKFIVMNQTSDDNGKAAQGNGADAAGAASPTLSRSMSGASGGNADVQAEEGAGDHQEESPRSQSVDSTSCSSVRYNCDSLMGLVLKCCLNMSKRIR